MTHQPVDQLTADLDAARELLRRVRAVIQAGSCTDDELLRVIAAIAEVGRACDSVEIVVAGEIGDRSRRQLGSERLCARKGCRTAIELIQRVTRVSSAAASKLLRVGEAVRPGVALSGESKPPRFPKLEAALSTADLCVDAANSIVAGLSMSSVCADRAAIEVAEAELVRAALGQSEEYPVPATADELRLQAAVWRSVIDPDGVEPDEERSMRHRSLTLGRATSGGVPLSGMLMPEAAARLQRLFDAYLSPVSASVAFPRAQRDTDGDSAGSVESSDDDLIAIAVDGRSRSQQQHDVFVSVLDSASRAADTPSIGGAPPTVIVTVRESDLLAGGGVGWAEGIEAPLSARTVRQLVCRGGVQRVVLSDEGRVVRLGVEQRCFNGRQRRAITLRDGGCIIPGCSVPASWCEIHHVEEFSGGGPTHSDNGILLCWFHHRTIDHSGWEIRMRKGVPEIMAAPWIDRRHRRWSPSTKSRTRIAHHFADRSVQATE